MTRIHVVGKERRYVSKCSVSMNEIEIRRSNVSRSKLIYRYGCRASYREGPRPAPAPVEALK